MILFTAPTTNIWLYYTESVSFAASLAITNRYEMCSKNIEKRRKLFFLLSSKGRLDARQKNRQTDRQNYENLLAFTTCKLINTWTIKDAWKHVLCITGEYGEYRMQYARVPPTTFQSTEVFFFREQRSFVWRSAHWAQRGCCAWQRNIKWEVVSFLSFFCGLYLV